MPRMLAAALLFCALTFQASAAVTVAIERTVAGLDEEGHIPAGANTLTVQLNIRAIGAPAELRALGIEEHLPTGWSFAEVRGEAAPDVARFDPASGALQFVWITVPALPTTIEYDVQLPGLPPEPVEITGRPRFRTDGPELLGDTIATEITASACLSFNRSLPNGCYRAGQQIVVQIELGTACVGVRALRLQETLPAGFSYVPNSASPPPSQLLHDPENPSALGFVWSPGQTLPHTLRYSLAVNAGIEGDAFLSGHVVYSTGETEVTSGTFETILCGIDEIPPALTLTGESEIAVECGGVFADPGATATDGTDGDLSAAIARSGELDLTLPGEYLLTYNVSDTAGNPAIPVTRIVTVADTQAPALQLLGPNPLRIPLHAPFIDPGATARDTCDGDLTANVSAASTVNTAIEGTYTVTYTVQDTAGLLSSAVRNVQVVAAAEPVLFLLGDTEFELHCGESFIDPGASAVDAQDGDISAAIRITGNVDSGNPGEYVLTYRVQDTDGNEAEPVQRRITVLGPAPLSAVALVSPSGDVIFASGTAVARVPLMSAVEGVTGTCEGAEVIVDYRVDGVLRGTSDAAADSFLLFLDLAPGTHTLTATARRAGSEPVTSEPLSITVRTAADAGFNGIPDAPFANLASGDQWAATRDGAACDRAVAIAAWDGTCGASDTGVITVAVPRADTAQTVLVEAPAALVHCDERALLMVATACDAASLLGSSWQELGDIADGLLPQGGYLAIQLLISTDNGASFHPVDPARLSSNPIRFSVTGLQTTGDASFYAHPAQITGSNAGNIELTAAPGNWNRDAIDQVLVENARLEARTQALGVFAALADGANNPALELQPNPGGNLVVGIAMVGDVETRDLFLGNAGGGIIDGTATITGDAAGAFSLRAGQTYTLAADSNAEVKIAFSPKTTGAFTATLTLTGADQPRTIVLTGTGTAQAGKTAFFGCGSSAGAGGILGDLTVIAAAAAMLLWRRRSTKFAAY